MCGLVPPRGGGRSLRLLSRLLCDLAMDVRVGSMYEFPDFRGFGYRSLEIGVEGV